MVSALHIGQNNKDVWLFTGYDMDLIETTKQNFEENKIWIDGKCDYQFLNTDEETPLQTIVGFWLDELAGEGELVRYTVPEEPISVEGIEPSINLENDVDIDAIIQSQNSYKPGLI